MRNLFTLIGALAIVVMSITALAAVVAADDDAELVINEFVFDTPSFDTREYIELFGDEETDYSAYTILAIEGDIGTKRGVIDAHFQVGMTDENGLWTTPLFLFNTLENGTVTLLLVKDFDFANFEARDDLDTDDDGTLDITPWSAIVDGVAVRDGGGSDKTYASAVVLGVAFDTIPGHVNGASRVPDGFDTDSATDWVRNDPGGAGLPGPKVGGTVDSGTALNTPGQLNVGETDDDDDEEDEKDEKDD